MAGKSTPRYIKPAVRLLQVAIAVQGAAVLLVLGGITGCVAFALSIFAAFELALWADFKWPDTFR